MGLDMFLHRRDKDKKPFEENLDPEWDHYEHEFIYWRKMNAIHNWMVKNIQGEIDDCQEYQITLEKLTFFYNELVRARLTRDQTIIPPGGGFFFGSVETDEYYWQQLRDVIEKLKPEIDRIKKYIEEEKVDSYPYTYFYSASW